MVDAQLGPGDGGPIHRLNVVAVLVFAAIITQEAVNGMRTS